MRATIHSPPGTAAWPGDAAQGQPGTQAQRRTRWPAWPRRWHARSPWLSAAPVLGAVAGFCALVQGPDWRKSAVLAAANLAVSLVFVYTGLMLRRDPDQRVTAWALMLAGVFRSLDFIDGWNGPWAVYATVFGGVDRVFGAWALLRYPNSALPALHRRYLAALTGWMLVGRTLIVVTSRAQWDGYQRAAWWPALVPDHRLSDTLNYVTHAGEGIGGIALIVLLALRLANSRGLDRIVITPVMAAGIVAVIATIASTVAMALNISGTPNGAYLTESLVDLGIPVAFLIAALQRRLGQLQAQAAEKKLEQVKASRARILEAELAERRRLERDLHDGVQQHLLGITAALTAALATTADPAAAAARSAGPARDCGRCWASSGTWPTASTRRSCRRAGSARRWRGLRNGSRSPCA